VTGRGSLRWPPALQPRPCQARPHRVAVAPARSRRS
jgi:hypothetical protein